MQVILSVIVMLVDLSVAIMNVTVSVAIIQLDVSAALMQVTVSAWNVGENVYCIYAGGSLCCNYAGGTFSSAQLLLLQNAGYCFCYSYVDDTFMQQFYIPFSKRDPLFIKLTGKHLKALYKVSISPFL